MYVALRLDGNKKPPPYEGVINQRKI